MKNTGIVRRLDELGRITLPKELRDVRGIRVGDPVEIYVDGDTICLRKKPEKICAICGKTEHLMEVERLLICRDCGCKVIDKYMED
jgi:transcriptional pleiotropic regulator of transition state genes